MPLKPPTPRRERILVFAPDKVGKSTCWWTIARYTDADFWIADTDAGYWQNADEFPDIDHERMHLEDNLITFEDVTDWGNDVLFNAKPDDWIILDRVDVLREIAKNYYLEQVYGKATAAWFLDKAIDIGESNRQIESGEKEGEKKAIVPTLGVNEWTIINTMFNSFLSRLNTRAKQQHIMMCAQAKVIEKQGTYAERDKRTLGTFGELGMKPEGGPTMPGIPGTILYISKWGEERRITTVGDRGREKKKRLDDAVLTDFVKVYLMNVAGWEIRE